MRGGGGDHKHKIMNRALIRYSISSTLATSTVVEFKCFLVLLRGKFNWPLFKWKVRNRTRLISNAVKIQQNLQELEKVTKHYCQPNPAWRQAEEEEFLHNLMMNLPKQKREKYQINVAIQPTGWCLGSCGIQQLPLWQASPILSLSISPLKDRLLWYCILPFTCLWAHCSETVKSKVLSIWFVWKN